jgi:hypothetical protein
VAVFNRKWEPDESVEDANHRVTDDRFRNMQR